MPSPNSAPDVLTNEICAPRVGFRERHGRRKHESDHPPPKPTIARIWRGRTSAAKADEYAAYYEHGIRPLEEKALARAACCARIAATRPNS